MDDNLYTYRARAIRVIDGDTLVLDVDLGMGIHSVQTCRLHGIDTPEVYGVDKDSDEYARGTRAARILTMAVTGQTLIVRTHKDRGDKYGRLLADVYVNGTNVADVLKQAGLA